MLLPPPLDRSSEVHFCSTGYVNPTDRHTDRQSCILYIKRTHYVLDTQVLKVGTRRYIKKGKGEKDSALSKAEKLEKWF